MKKRIFLFLLIALFLTACGNNSEKTSSHPDEVNVAVSVELDSMDPYRSDAANTEMIMNNIFDGLFDTDEKGQIVPALCESYDISEDHLHYTFHLKKDVSFHNGKDFTADDVVYSLTKLAGLDDNEPMHSRFTRIASAKKIDDHTVEVTLKEVDASFLALLIRAIVPEGYEEQETHPIGTGPYKFVSRTPGQELVMEANENYYNKDHQPQIQKITWIKMADEQTTVMALKSGEIDLAHGMTPQALGQLKDQCHVVSGPQNLVQQLALNNDFGPLQDLRVRQALSYGIDKDELIATVAEGGSTKLGSNFSPAMEVYYREGLEDYYAYDPEKAKALLAEAGYGDGLELKVTVSSDYKFHMDTAELIAMQLEKIGVNLVLDPVEFTTWLERVYTNREFQTSVMGFVGHLDPNEILERFESDYRKNFINFKNSRYDQLIEEGRREVDPEQRAEIYKEAQEVLTENAASVYLQDPNQNIIMNSQLDGIKLYPIQKLNMEDLHWTR